VRYTVETILKKHGDGTLYPQRWKRTGHQTISAWMQERTEFCHVPKETLKTEKLDNAEVFRVNSIDMYVAVREIDGEGSASEEGAQGSS